MAIKTFKPTTPSRRHMTVSAFEGIDKKAKPERSLVESQKKHAGRNSYGRITVRHHGGGNKQKYRIIDFKRDKMDVPATVLRLEYDPNRSAFIALVQYEDGEKRYIIAPVGLKAGDKIISSASADIKPGNCLPIANIPVGTVIHNIEMHPGKGAQLVRSAGTAAQLMAKENGDAQIRMPSGEVRIRINELLANENLDERFSIPDSVIRVNATLDWNDLLAKTLSANASLLMAEHNSSLAELDLKSIRSRFYPYLNRNYPYVNLTTGYGYTYNRYGTGGNLSRGTLGLNAGVKVGFTIFDGNRRREQRNARIGVENAQLTQQRLEQSLRADLSNFWQAYRNNLEVILLEEENLIAAKENYEIAMERYLLGDLPGIEMREAQKSLLDAEERILTAQYNTKLCEISLQQISGNVMVYLE